MKSIIVTLAFLLFSMSAFAETFEEKDADQDGKLSVSEYAGDDKKLKKNFKKLDQDADGSLSAEEFAADSGDKKKGKKDKKKKDKKGKKDKNAEESI